MEEKTREEEDLIKLWGAQTGVGGGGWGLKGVVGGERVCC